MIPFEMQYNLDDDGEGAIAIKIVPLVESGAKDKKKLQAKKNDTGYVNRNYVHIDISLRVLSI